MTLGKYRPAERIQPGWLIACGPPESKDRPGAVLDQWCEVRVILDYQSGRRDIAFTDGTKTYVERGDVVRCITLAEKRQRREALGEAS